MAYTSNTKPARLGIWGFIVLLLASQAACRNIDWQRRQLSLPLSTTIDGGSTMTTTDAIDFPGSTIMPTVTQALNQTSTITASSTQTYKSDKIPIYLNVRPSSANDDVLGMLNVSGFYGPGAWAGWFITIMASWLHIAQEPESKIDTNAWTYLLLTNFASIDLMRHLSSYSRLHKAGDATAAYQLYGSIGASYTIVWWGFFHAAFQALVSLTMLMDSTKFKKRFLTLATGLALPAISLCVFISIPSLLDEDATHAVPVLYQRGEYISGHTYFMIMVTLLGPWTVILLGGATMIYAYTAYTSQEVKDRVEKIPSGCDTLWGAYVGSGFVICYILFFVAIFSDHLWILWLMAPWMPLLFMFYYFILPFSAGITVAIFILDYVFEAYVRFGHVPPSQSCFFMPCAPQPLRDTDQAFSLFLGLVLLFGAEFAPGYLHRLKESSQFVRDMNTRMNIELGRRGRADEERAEVVNTNATAARVTHTPSWGVREQAATTPSVPGINHTSSWDAAQALANTTNTD